MNLAARSLTTTGLTQRALAHALGVSLGALNRWANGRAVPPPAVVVLLQEAAEGAPSAAWAARLDEGRRMYPDGRGRHGR